jgi:hypothetical protein
VLTGIIGDAQRAVLEPARDAARDRGRGDHPLGEERWTV